MKDMGYMKGDGTLKCKKKELDGPWWETVFVARDDKQKPEVEFIAGPGTHKIDFNGRTIWAHHHQDQTLVTGWERIPEEQEFIHLITFGQDTQILKDFIDAAIVHSMKKDEGMIGIYEQHRWGIGWTKVQSKKPRSLNSVVLDTNL